MPIFRVLEALATHSIYKHYIHLKDEDTCIQNKCIGVHISNVHKSLQNIVEVKYLFANGKYFVSTAMHEPERVKVTFAELP